MLPTSHFTAIFSWRNMGDKLLVLAFLSGVCGLAYEVLYARLLSSYLGNIFYVTAAILTSFLLSYGIGALIAHRYVRLLPHIEIAIGVYGVLFATFMSSSGFSLTTFAATLSVASPIVLIAISFFLLLIPALLVGFSIPLFTLYITHYRNAGDEFQNVYLFYNMGAALAVLFIEFILLRTIGIHASILSIAFVNGVIGILLFFVTPPQKETIDTNWSKEITRAEWFALFLTGVGSGIFQIFIIRLSYFIFGPLNENFSIILSSVLFGIAFGSILAMTKVVSFRTLLLMCALAAFLPLLVLDQFVSLYSTALYFSIPYGLETVAKTVFLIMLTLPVFTLYGATIPHIVRGVRQENIARGALALSSFGNAFGYLLFVFVLYEYLPEYLIPAVIAFLFIAGYTLLHKRNIRYAFASTVGIVILTSMVILVWPSHILDVGYRAFYSPDGLERARSSITETSTFKKFGSSATISTRDDGSKLVSLDGYVSLRLRENGASRLNETIVGFVPALFSKEHGRALVFGLGTGITAGATAAAYEDTTIAEINPAMLPLTEHFTEDNLNVLGNPRATVILQDGILALLQDDTYYDTIVNTVPSPTFFSANKLWTKDVFDIAASKLNDGGVFVGWMDSYLDTEGIAIMHNTLHKSFADCVYVYLATQYVSFVCGNDELSLTSFEDSYWSTPVQKQFESYHLKTSIADFIEGLLLNPKPMGELAPTLALNTLDLPLLEFVHSSDLAEVSEYVSAFFRASMPLAPFAGEGLSTSGRERRCNALQAVRSRALPAFCLNYLDIESARLF